MIEYLLLILFFITENKKIKLLLLTLTLIIVILKLPKNLEQEKFITLNSLDNLSSLKSAINKCCNEDEIKILKKTFLCLKKNKKIYHMFEDDIEKIVPSEKSIFSKLTRFL